MKADRPRMTSIGRACLALTAALLLIALVPLTASGQSGEAAGPAAESAAKKKGKKKAKGPNPCAKGGKKARRKCRARDRQDKVIGNPESPKRQRLNGKAIPTPNADRCDFLDTSQCLLPWPNDKFTVASGSTDTGRRLDLKQASMPAATANPAAKIDPTNWNKSDGFSPGQTIVLKVPQLDTNQAYNNTNFVRVNNLRAFTSPATSAVVINAATGQRHPIWVELDSRPVDPAPGSPQGSNADRNLLIQSATNFEEGARYIVALRNLRNAANKVIPAPPAFRAYRDRLITKQKPVESRRGKIEGLIQRLKSRGIKRGSLYMAWDFTVASEGSIADWMLSMRDDALGAKLGDPDLDNGTVEDGNAPTFTVDSVDTAPTNANFVRIVNGTLTDVPCYLEHATNADECAPGAQFAFSNAADRTPNFSAATTDVPFRCVIPASVTDGVTVTPSRAAEFGHGLLGSHTAVSSQNEIAPLAGEHNITFCAVDWAGFSALDGGTVGDILQNMSNFPKLPDRTQQGYLNFIWLGRAMLHSDGFNDNPAFQLDPADPEDAVNGGTPVIDPSDLYFEGISQGAVLGGGLTAVSPDISRSILNVPGMRYTLLLPRSTHWVPETTNPGAYEFFFGNQNLKERSLILSMIQVLWDRGETNGYAHHATDDPYPDTPPHQVLLQPAFGDFQVANLAAEIEARTMGMSVYTPALDPGRHWESNPFMGIPAIGGFPFTGSALVYWDGGPPSFTGTVDIGTGTPPNTNTAPRESLGYGNDPHGYPRRDAKAREQISDFFNGGFDYCGSGGYGVGSQIPCYSNGWTGP